MTTGVDGEPPANIDWPGLPSQVLAMEQAGLVTRTFRRLDPARQTGLIDAILDEAAEHGLAELSMKRVSSRAQISVGSLYQYFGDRARLLKFAVEICKSYMKGVFDEAIIQLQDMPLLEALVAYVEGGCDWMSREQSLMRLFVRAAYGGDTELAESLVRPLALNMRGLLLQLLKSGVTRGEVRADVDLETSVSVLHTLAIAIGDGRLVPSLEAYFQLCPNVGTAKANTRALFATALSGIIVKANG